MVSRPRRYEEARSIRQRLDLSQVEAAERYGGVSQAYISALENGKRDSLEEREYLDWLRAGARKRGERKTRRRARAAQTHRERPDDLRGEPLQVGFRHDLHLPTGWMLLAVTRTAHDAEIATLYHDATDSYGLVGFHLVDGSIRRARIIPFEPEHNRLTTRALSAFARGAYDWDAIEPDDEIGALLHPPGDESGELLSSTDKGSNEPQDSL